MSESKSLNIIIRSQAELAGFSQVATELGKQIADAKLAGKAYEELEGKLRSVTEAMKDYAEAASDARDPGELSFERRSPSQPEGDVDGGDTYLFGGKTRGKLLGRLGRVALAYLTLKTAYSTAKAAVTEYSKSQETLGQLEASLRSRGQNVAAYKDHIIELAQAYEAAYNIDSDEWIKAASVLTQGGAGSANMDRYMATVKDLAGLMDGNVASAAEAMSRALNGSFETFSRMGIKMEEAWTQAEKFEHLAEEIHKRGGGLLEERAKGLSGQFEDMNLKLQNLSKGFGKVITDTGILQKAMSIANDVGSVFTNVVGTVAETFSYNLFEQKDATKAANDATKDYAKTADQTAVPVKKMAENSKEAAEDLQRITEAASEANEELANLNKEEEARLSHEQKMLKAQEKYDLARIKNARKAGMLTDDQAAQLEFVTRSGYARRGQAMEQAGYRREIGANQAEISRINADLRTMAGRLSPEQYNRVQDVAIQRQSVLFERNRELKARAGYSAREFGAEMQAQAAEAGDTAARALGATKNAFVTFANGMNGRIDDLTRTIVALDARTRHLRR